MDSLTLPEEYLSWSEKVSSTMNKCKICNLWGSVQNGNACVLVQTEKKSVTKCTKI